MIKPKVLFLCTGNSCRTQMAEAWLRDLAGEQFEITSAGSENAPLDPVAVQAMREVGIEISDQEPKDVVQFLGQRFTYVISLCHRQEERTCPTIPGAIWRLEWAIPNPAVAESMEEHWKVVRLARDQIREKVVEFVANN